MCWAPAVCQANDQHGKYVSHTEYVPDARDSVMNSLDSVLYLVELTVSQKKWTASKTNEYIIINDGKNYEKEVQDTMRTV